MACGSGEGLAGTELPGLIGFVGGIGPGVGFVGGGRGTLDAGANLPDASEHGQGGSGGGPMSGHDSGSGLGQEDGGGSEDEHDAAGTDAGSSIGVAIQLPPGFFSSLDWTIVGPGGSYAGSVQFGQAQSIEFVVGEIQMGSGYTLILRGTDPSGDPCVGISAPFAVRAGATTGVSVTIQCFTGDGGAEPATVTTGSVAVDAGVAMP